MGALQIIVSDSVRFCPDCEKPNQFGELCGRCISDRELERENPSEFSILPSEENARRLRRNEKAQWTN